MKNKFILLHLCILLSACSDNYTPKPLGYFRIDLAEKEYELFNNNCSYEFLIPKNSQVINGKKDCWFNINYPQHNATIYLTYKALNSDLAPIIEESHKLVYDHSIKSDAIVETVYLNDQNKVYGILYDIHGNSASNLQFFATDSTNHFLRGSLYFNNIPNADSLQPVKDYIKEDLEVLIESLNWN